MNRRHWQSRCSALPSAEETWCEVGESEVPALEGAIEATRGDLGRELAELDVDLEL